MKMTRWLDHELPRHAVQYFFHDVVKFVGISQSGGVFRVLAELSTAAAAAKFVR